MLCRLVLALVCGVALAAPALADQPGRVAPRQADWKVVAGFSTWKPETRNRIFYARVPTQIKAWKLHVYETADTRRALHQNFSRYGLLAIFLTERPSRFTVDGIYLDGDGSLNIQIRAAPPPPPVCLPPGPGAADAPCASGPFPSDSQYRLIAIRKDSLPSPVKRLYISEVP